MTEPHHDWMMWFFVFIYLIDNRVDPNGHVQGKMFIYQLTVLLYQNDNGKTITVPETALAFQVHCASPKDNPCLRLQSKTGVPFLSYPNSCQISFSGSTTYESIAILTRSISARIPPIPQTKLMTILKIPFLVSPIMKL